MIVRRAANGIRYYCFEGLSQHHGIFNAVFTRVGGVSRLPFSQLNVGQLVGDELAAVEINHRLIYQTLGLSEKKVVTARQVHGCDVAVVDVLDGGRTIPGTDALITSTPGLSLILRFADCLPIFLFDPEEQVVGLGHAGWRGTAARLAHRMVSVMMGSFGSDPPDIIAGLGPAIGPCCYQIGANVAQQLTASLEDCQGALHPSEGDAFHFDLWEANRQQLMRLGIHRIETCHICTACHTSEFFSHRAERGRTGRFAAVIGIRSPE